MKKYFIQFLPFIFIWVLALSFLVKINLVKASTFEISDGSVVNLWHLDGNPDDEIHSDTLTGVINDYSSIHTLNGENHHVPNFVSTNTNNLSRNPTHMPTGSQSRTYSFWFNTTAGAEMGLFEAGTWGVSGQSLSAVILSSGNGGWIAMTANGAECDTNHAINLRDNLWHNYIYTYDVVSNNSSCYIDGVLQQTVNTISNATLSSHLILGLWQTNIEYFNGFLDEVVVMDRVATAAEITGLSTSYVRVVPDNIPLISNIVLLVPSSSYNNIPFSNWQFVTFFSTSTPEAVKYSLEWGKDYNFTTSTKLSTGWHLFNTDFPLLFGDQMSIVNNQLMEASTTYFWRVNAYLNFDNNNIAFTSASSSFNITSSNGVNPTFIPVGYISPFTATSTGRYLCSFNIFGNSDIAGCFYNAAIDVWTFIIEQMDKLGERVGNAENTAVSSLQKIYPFAFYYTLEKDIKLAINSTTIATTSFDLPEGVSSSFGNLTLYNASTELAITSKSGLNVADFKIFIISFLTLLICILIVGLTVFIILHL